MTTCNEGPRDRNGETGATSDEDLAEETGNRDVNTNENSDEESNVNDESVTSVLSKYVIKRNDWSKWASEIEIKVKRSIKAENNAGGSDLNVYCFPGLATYLLQNINLISMWGCVIHNDFEFDGKQSSSAAVESDFNDIKNRLCKDVSLPIRVDEFVQKHITYLSGKLYLLNENNETERTPDANQHLDASQTEKETKIVSDHVTETENNSNAGIEEEPNRTVSGCIVCSNKDYPSGAHSCIICQKFVHVFEPCSFPVDGEEEGFGEKRVCFECRNNDGRAERFVNDNTYEDWRGQVSQHNKQKKNKQSYYLQKKHTKSSFSDKKKKEISILRNGNDSSLGFVTINRKKYSLANTCGFDSLFQIFSVAYMDYSEVKNMIDSNTALIGLFAMIQKLDSENKITTATYKDRCEYLMKYFEPTKQKYGNNYLVQCAFTVAALTPKFFEHLPCYKEIYRCTCGNETTFNVNFVKTTRHDIMEDKKTGEDLSKLVTSYVKSNGPNKKVCGKDGCTNIFTKTIIPGNLSYRNFKALQLFF